MKKFLVASMVALFGVGSSACSKPSPPASNESVTTAASASASATAAAPSSAPTPVASASAALTPSATVAASASAAPGEKFALHCLAHTPSKETIRVEIDGSKTPMAGTVTLDGTAIGTRRFKVHALPQAATYSMIFAGYAAGDKKPGDEKLTTGKSTVVRMVANGNKDELYFDSDIKLPGDTKPMSKPLLCEK